MKYEELVKWLRVTCGSCKLWDGHKCCLKGECSAQTRLQAADAIEELSKKRDAACWGCKCSKIERNEWIPVTERLPTGDDYMPCYENYDGAVLWYTNSGVMGLGWYYDSTGNWSDTEDCSPLGKVTHWMPLPQPPKEET